MIMKIDVKEGRVLVESISVYQVSDTCFYLMIDFKSKRPELVAYYAGSEAVLDFAANEETLRVNKDGDPFTSIRVFLDRDVRCIVAERVGRYTCMATLFTEKPTEKIVIEWIR